MSEGIIKGLKTVHKAVSIVLENKEVIVAACKEMQRTVSIPLNDDKDLELFLRLGFCSFADDVRYHIGAAYRGADYEVLEIVNTMYIAETGVNLVEISDMEWEDIRSFPVPSGEEYVTRSSAYSQPVPIWNDEDCYGQERWKYVEWVKQTCELELAALGEA